jgi:photosystem II stability/assembly factor-like uncharacterized protein
MSIGSGQASRIYLTTDAGRHWTLQYTATRSAIFLDDLFCASPVDCYAVSDQVDGKFLILHTEDGKTWRELPRDAMPPALPNEGVFAASGTSLAISKNSLYFVTGGAAKARVFRSSNRGRIWTASVAPISAGNASSGIFSIARRGNAVVIVGGDYKKPTHAKNSAAYSPDRGLTWSLAASGPRGFRSAVAFIDNSTLIAVGPSGEDISRDGGAHWTAAGSLNLNAVAVLGSQVWAVGPKGTVARMLLAAPSASH